jgi:hypothetical protein
MISPLVKARLCIHLCRDGVQEAPGLLTDAEGKIRPTHKPENSIYSFIFQIQGKLANEVTHETLIDRSCTQRKGRSGCGMSVESSYVYRLIAGLGRIAHLNALRRKDQIIGGSEPEGSKD